MTDEEELHPPFLWISKGEREEIDIVNFAKNQAASDGKLCHPALNRQFEKMD